MGLYSLSRGEVMNNKYNVGDMFSCDYGANGRAVMLILDVKNNTYLFEHNYIDKKTGFQNIQRQTQDAQYFDALINIGKHSYFAANL
jgi:hypothetical protein